MTEHTPTPWSYKLARFPTDGEYDCGIAAVIDGKPYCIAEAVGRCSAKITLPSEANAAFIVKAVNSHQPLIDMLKETVLQLEYMQERISTSTGAAVLSRANYLLGSVESAQ